LKQTIKFQLSGPFDEVKGITQLAGAKPFLKFLRGYPITLLKLPQALASASQPNFKKPHFGPKRRLN